MKRAIPILCATAAVALLAPQVAAAATQTATAGDITATFTYQGKYPNYHGESMRISRAGQVVYDQPVRSPNCGTGRFECAPGGVYGRNSVHIVNLESTTEPNVVLDLYTNGAHCCWVEQVFSFDSASSTYTKADRAFFDGDRLVDARHDGLREFLTVDSRFDYAFTDFAASGAPIQILSFAHGKFTDITRQFPKLIAGDAARWMKAFRALARDHYSDSVGVVAAWAADEDMLGHSKLVARFLARQVKLGHLKSPVEPGGAKFVRALQKMLRKDGYVR
jgi:hypothetical protein